MVHSHGSTILFVLTSIYCETSMKKIACISKNRFYTTGSYMILVREQFNKCCDSNSSAFSVSERHQDIITSQGNIDRSRFPGHAVKGDTKTSLHRTRTNVPNLLFHRGLSRFPDAHTKLVIKLTRGYDRAPRNTPPTHCLSSRSSPRTGRSSRRSTRPGWRSWRRGPCQSSR